LDEGCALDHYEIHAVLQQPNPPDRHSAWENPTELLSPWSRLAHHGQRA
jgi:hypothetical protein